MTEHPRKGIYNFSPGRLARSTRKLDSFGMIKPGTMLDAYNDTLPVGVTLHPTKGYRRRAAKSIVAELINGERRAGVISDSAAIKKRLAQCKTNGHRP